MCQIIPFTLPCCRRVYVEISRLPSCPDEWPKKKCPKDFCLRVRRNAQDREAGTCWRCEAEMAGKIGQAREGMRPGIDKAAIVGGLEEVDPHDRRRMTEAGGHCWFCGARSSCESCHSKKIPEGVPEGHASTPSKRPYIHPGFVKARHPTKRSKMDPVSSRMATLNSAYLHSVNPHAQKTPPAWPSRLDPALSFYLPPSNDGSPVQQTFTATSPSASSVFSGSFQSSYQQQLMSSSPLTSSPFSCNPQTRGDTQDINNTNNQSLAHGYVTQPFIGVGQNTRYPSQHTQQSFNFAAPSGDLEFSTYLFFADDPNTNGSGLSNAPEDYGMDDFPGELKPSDKPLSSQSKLDQSFIDPSLANNPDN
ncbi:hypothetical protein BGZ60DRAFT_83938 [Tricladium varicosporioides]|nr:hypothetical protein BGZ60DRAFT_83938 [Hymenoscyphus varicosporioides]